MNGDDMRAFIVSSGRTGTHFLADYIDRYVHPARHQPNPDGYDVAHAYARKEINLDSVVKWLNERDLGNIIEVNPFLFSMIEPINTLWPEAKCIYVIRDPVAFCRSGIKRAWYREKTDSYYTDFYYPEAPQYPLDPYRDAWSKMRRVQKIAWYWRFLNATICSGLNPKKTCVVSFEAIFNPPYSGMRTILEYLGHGDRWFPEAMNNIISASTNTLEDLVESDIPSIQEIAFNWNWKAYPDVRDIVTSYLSSNDRCQAIR